MELCFSSIACFFIMKIISNRYFPPTMDRITKMCVFLCYLLTWKLANIKDVCSGSNKRVSPYLLRPQLILLLIKVYPSLVFFGSNNVPFVYILFWLTLYSSWTDTKYWFHPHTTYRYLCCCLQPVANHFMTNLPSPFHPLLPVDQSVTHLLLPFTECLFPTQLVSQ